MAKHQFIYLLASVAVIALAGCANSPQAQRYLATRGAATVTAQQSAAQAAAAQSKRESPAVVPVPTPLVASTVASTVGATVEAADSADGIRGAAQSDDWQLPSALIGALVVGILIAIGMRIAIINRRDDKAAWELLRIAARLMNEDGEQ